MIIRIFKTAVIAFFALCVCSCDFVRGIAGRPTSRDIEDIKFKLAVAAAEKERRALLDDDDEYEAEETAADVPCEEEFLVPEGIKLSSSRLVRDPGSLPRYLIIVGAFGNEANARTVADRANEAGHEAVFIPYTNGLVAVGLCPTDDLKTVCETLERLRGESFCPSDAWILENSK